MNEINCVGVLAHPLRPNTHPVATRIKDTLQARGFHAWAYTTWQEDDVQADVQRADMVIAIGGDGSMLRAARVCAAYNVAVLGINMGQLGFLTEIDNPESWETHFNAILSGDCWIERRTMIRAEVWRDGVVVGEGEALNDIVISGTVVGRMIQLDAYLDDDWTTTYTADALVIATATGSTAYALACGGPILPPELGNILIVPAAPHLSMDRPIVLAEGARVEVAAISSKSSAVMLSADGTPVFELLPEDRVRVQVSDHITRFIRLRGRNYFYRSLLDRLEPRSPRIGRDEKLQT